MNNKRSPQKVDLAKSNPIHGAINFLCNPHTFSMAGIILH